MNVSTNAITGTNKKKPQFWRDVHALFMEVQQERPCEIGVRNEGMIKARWKWILERVNVFVGKYDESKRNVGKMSQRNDHDVLQVAVRLYKEENGTWNMDHAWRMMMKYPKWKILSEVPTKLARGGVLENDCFGKGKASLGSVPAPSNAMESESDNGGSGKRMKLNDRGYSTQGSDDEGVEIRSFMMRPNGNKTAKAKAQTTNSGNSSGGSASEATQVVLHGFSERNALYQFARFYSEDKRMKLEREKLEYNKKKEARVVASENKALLMKLIDKEIAKGLTEEEMSFKAYLLKLVVGA